MKIVIVSILLFIYSFTDAQFDKELNELRSHYADAPFYYLGNFFSSDTLYHHITIDNGVKIDTPRAFFYLILTIDDTDVSCIPGSGGNNSLWCDDVKEKIVGNEKKCMVLANWHYYPEKWNIEHIGGYLGYFKVWLYKKNEYDHLIFFELKKQ